MQRANRGRRLTLQDFGRRYFARIQHAVAVGVQAAVGCPTTAEADSVAFRYVADRDKGVKAIGTIRTVGAVGAIVTLTGSEEQSCGQHARYVNPLSHGVLQAMKFEQAA